MICPKTLRTGLMALLFSVVAIGSTVAQAQLPLVFTVNPSTFSTSQSVSTDVCMMPQNTAAPVTVLPGDVFTFIFDPLVGTVNTVDTLTVNSATLAPGDFTATLGASNPNKVILSYTNGASKSFAYGNSVCASVHFTSAATATGSLVRFSSRLDGNSGNLPFQPIQVVNFSNGGGVDLANLPGDSAQIIGMLKNSNAANPGNSLTIHAGGANAGSTDVKGGDIVVAPGTGTGLGAGGNVRVQTAGANDLSGTLENLLVDREIYVSRGKQLTLSSPGFTSLMSIHLVGTHTAGGRVYYMVRATDGGSQIATEEGIIQYLATANSITCTVQTTDKLHLGTVNSGCTPGFFNPGSQPGVSIFDNVSFSSPAPIVVHEVYFRVTNESGSSIRLEP